MTASEVSRIRHALGLTQAELAARMGVHVRTVSRWEYGGRKCVGPAEAMLAGLSAEALAKAESAQEGRERLGREIAAPGGAKRT